MNLDARTDRNGIAVRDRRLLVWQRQDLTRHRARHEPGPEVSVLVDRGAQLGGVCELPLPQVRPRAPRHLVPFSGPVTRATPPRRFITRISGSLPSSRLIAAS